MAPFPIGPYQSLPAACFDYDPRAPLVARQVATLITAVVAALAVEHFGGTSIPGCAGKGVIDLMVLYPSGQLDAAQRVLAALGFQPQGGRDPFPEDRPMRVGSIAYDGATFRLHAHVLAADAPEVEELRRFRDRLRADPRLVAAYVARKRAILRDGIDDAIDYCNAKGGSCVEVLEQDGSRRA